MQPAGSHRIPAPRLSSVCARASRVGGEPLSCTRRYRRRCGRWRAGHPIRGQRASARPRRSERRAAACVPPTGWRWPAAPHLSAQRRFEQAQHHKPGAAEQQRADPERRHAADRARQARDPERDRDHPVDAEAHQVPERRRRIRTASTTTPRMPIGMVQRRHHRHRDQVRKHAIGRQPVEVVGRKERRRETREQRHDERARAAHVRPRARSRTPRGVSAAELIHDSPRS